MADLTLDPLEEPSILGEQTHKPLVFNSNTDTNTISNILLIDSNVMESQIFYDSANERTFPIIYSYESSRDELLQLLQNKFTSIERISFVFHDSINGKTFLNGEPFFLETDFYPDNLSLSSNVQFLLKIITDFAVKNVDFLQCNSLNHENWVKYYDLLNKNTNVVVGGSSDETGNLQYGGNWIMENTSEDIQKVYLTDYISNYSSTLDTIQNNVANGENIIIMYNGANYYYRLDNTTSSWTLFSSTTSHDFSNNSTTKTMNVTFVQQTYSYPITSVNFCFNIKSNNITFDGCGNTFFINNVPSYGGLFRNGTSSTDGFYGITIKNFITTSSGTTTIASSGGNLLSSYFGRNINNYDFSNNRPSKVTDTFFIKIENCTNNGVNLYGNETAGIVGSYFCQGGYGIISNCTNNAYISNSNCGGIVGSYCADTSGCVLIQNCRNTFNVSYNGPVDSGGICGPNACLGGVLDISGCINSGIVYGNAGICANNAARSPSSILRITNCENTGVIYLSSCGIFGYINSSHLMGTIIIDGCINRGHIYSNDGGAGICGTVKYPKINKGVFIIKNCSNYGEINSDSTSGIVSKYAGSGNTTSGSNVDASLNPVNVINCTNYSIINATSCGGIVGFNAASYGGSINIINCCNVGNIVGGYCGGIVSQMTIYDTHTFSTVIINNCFNYGTISGARSGGICGPNFGFNCKLIAISNCYNLGNISGTSCGGIMGADAGYGATNTTNFTLNQIIDISNCYSTGTIADGNNSGAILGAKTKASDGTSGSSFTLKIKNCYTLSDPNYSTNITNSSFINLNFWDSSTNKINSQNLTGILPLGYINGIKTKGDGFYTYVDISNNYSIASSSNVWNDASANLRLLNTPTGLYSNNPANTWFKINSSTNTPYLLSSFNSPIYDPSNVIITQQISYNTSRGLFDPSGNYKYSLVSVNDADPAGYNTIISIDPSFGNLTFTDKVVSKTAYTAKVFVSKTDVSGKLFNYNFNQFMFRNDYFTDTIRNKGFVYIKQNTNNVIQYSPDKTVWTDISGGNAPDGKITISSIDPSATNILNVLFTSPITLSVDNSCNFVVKSNYITFDGSYNNTVDGSYNKITFNNLNNYGGFIQNGTDDINGYYGIKVQNFITDISGTSALYSNDSSGNADGWLVGSYFGKNSKTVSGFNKTRVADAISIKNITNKAPVTSNYAGGICGSNFGFNSYATIENCSNVGDISGNYAGGICGSRVASNSGEVTITKTFNSASIRGQGSGGLCGTSSALPNATIISAADTSSNLIIRNSYSTGHINGINAGGICGSNTGFTSGNNYGSSTVLIENSYSLGDVTNTNGGKIIGGTNLSSTDVSFNNIIKIDISNCYGYGDDSTNNLNLHGNNFLPLSQSSSNKLTVNQTKWYNALKNSWLDASASLGIDGPANIYNNNPGSVWTSFKKNNPYVLSNFNSPIYNPNTASFVNLSTDYKQRSGLFSYDDYSYNLITVNDIDPSYNGVYIDSSGASAGALVFPSTIKPNKDFSAEVFVSKGVEPYYTNYNYNNFTFSNTRYTIDASSTVYIKQDASLNILYSINQTNWTKIVGNVTIYNSNWANQIITVLFQTDITIDPSNSSYYDATTGTTENFCFVVKSSYITFDGSNNNITFENQTNYTGFIQNGTANINGYYGITVKNFNTKISDSSVNGDLYTNYDICGNDTKRSVEPDSAGWLIASYFGKNSKTRFTNDKSSNVAWTTRSFNPSIDVVSVQNSKNYVFINSRYGGGICGSYFGYGNSYATIINCSNSGDIADNVNQYIGCGGICGAGVGSYGGTVEIYNCNNDGIIYTEGGGGICGSHVANNDSSSNVLISSCYSVSNIKSKNAGGICGQSVGCGNNSKVTIQNCYSIGDIFGTDTENGRTAVNSAGGICGADLGYKLTYSANATLNSDASGVTIKGSNISIENCYAIGDISGNGGKLIGGCNIGTNSISNDSTNTTINIKKCFTNDSTNSDSGYTNNNIAGESFTYFLVNNNTYNTNQKRINFTAKTFTVDIFNNQD